jgi:hypothetical protein
MRPRRLLRQVIVYFLTCACVDFFTTVLPHLPGMGKAKLQLFALHGRLKQVRSAAHRPPTRW